MNWKKLLRLRRSRARGSIAQQEPWKSLPPRKEKWLEKILLEGTIFALPLAAILLVPHLAGRLGAAVDGEYRISLIEEKVKLPDDPPPLPAPEPPEEEKKEKQKKKPVVKKEEEPEEEEPEEEEPEKLEQTYGIDEGSLAGDGEGGFAVPVGDSLMVEPGQKKAPPPPPPPPPKKAKPKIYDEKQVTKKPTCLKKAVPRYTDRALDHDIEGKVVLLAVIDAGGNVKSVKVISGPGYGLEEACVAAVKKARYEPAKLDGRPVTCKMKLTFNFKLE